MPTKKKLLRQMADFGMTNGQKFVILYIKKVSYYRDSVDFLIYPTVAVLPLPPVA